MGKLSKFELRRQISQLNSLDLTKSDYKTLKSKVQRITEGMATVIGLTGGGEAFFRVRRNPPAKLTTLTDLGPPPAQYVTGFQRCNAPSEPMFYVASRRSTALAETRVERGDRIYLSQWIGLDQIPFNRLFDADLTDEWQAKIAETSSEVQTYFETLFTRRIHATFSDDYKITAAIADHLTTGFTKSDRQKVHDDQTVALRYPSVATKNGSYNTIMHPSFAADRLKPLHVMEIEIMGVNGDSFACRILDNAFTFDGDLIIWTDDPSRYPDENLEPGTLMQSDGQNWNLALSSDAYDQDRVDRLMAE